MPVPCPLTTPSASSSSSKLISSCSTWMIDCRSNEYASRTILGSIYVELAFLVGGKRAMIWVVTCLILTICPGDRLGETDHTLQLPDSDSAITLSGSTFILTELSVLFHQHVRGLFRDLPSISMAHSRTCSRQWRGRTDLWAECPGVTNIPL